ncbi:MAG: subclass B1 metallo-beta-lactamase, partial [Bacteroidetes bacterium]
MLSGCFSFGCNTIKLAENYNSQTLKVERLSDNTFNHISYLETDTYGKVACNGMVVANNGEAIIVDTPPDDASSEELINWVEQELKCEVKAVVGTHFHDDCLGGLEAFHNRNI